MFTSTTKINVNIKNRKNRKKIAWMMPRKLSPSIIISII
jgi:hypothetical protein